MTGREILALVLGDIPGRPALVRVHHECPRGDTFGAECDCQELLHRHVDAVSAAGTGVLIYLRSSGNGCAHNSPPGLVTGTGNHLRFRADATDPGAPLPLRHCAWRSFVVSRKPPGPAMTESVSFGGQDGRFAPVTRAGCHGIVGVYEVCRSAT
ncbi:hypothetical protein [Amycolatopsis pithecellobii]